MELRHLEYFIAVAAELSFSRAAERIHVVQSALSVAVAKLEKELGVALFDRTRRQIALTATGEVFLRARARGDTCGAPGPVIGRGLPRSTDGKSRWAR